MYVRGGHLNVIVHLLYCIQSFISTCKLDLTHLLMHTLLFFQDIRRRFIVVRPVLWFQRGSHHHTVLPRLWCRKRYGHEWVSRSLPNTGCLNEQFNANLVNLNVCCVYVIDNIDSFPKCSRWYVCCSSALNRTKIKLSWQKKSESTNTIFTCKL